MKALKVVNSLLIAVVIQFTFASYSVAKVNPKQEIENYEKGMTQMLKDAAETNVIDPKVNAWSVFPLLDSMLEAGLVSPENVEASKKDFRSLNIQGLKVGRVKNIWKRTYVRWAERTFKKFYKEIPRPMGQGQNSLVNNPINLDVDPASRLSEFNIATTYLCKENHYKMPLPQMNDPKTTQCPKGKGVYGQSCTSHTDCCAGICNVDYEGSVGQEHFSSFSKEAKEKKRKTQMIGKCGQVKACFLLIPKGRECTSVQPYCEGANEIKTFIPGQTKPDSTPKTHCMAVNYNSSNVGECIKTGQKGSADKCCSGASDKGICISKRVCMQCHPRGVDVKPNDKTPCCHGLYLNTKGRCIPDFPPYLPIKVEVKKRSLFKTLSQFLFSSAHAASVQCEGWDCVGQAKGMELKLDQSKQLSEMMELCLAHQNEKKKTECLKQLDAQRAQMMEANLKDKSGEKKDKQKFAMEDYVKRHNIPAFTSAERSDVTKCKFNSWKDNWADALPVERNAEVIIRGFEVVLSGIGTEDLIMVEDEKGGLKKNIYQRAKGVADKLRQGRKTMALSLARLDREMSCSCMNVYGPEKFPQDMQKAYGLYCSEAPIKQECQEYDIGKKGLKGGVDKDTNRKGSADCKVGDKEKKIADTDLGATALSHEWLLVDWLYKRSAHQIERFQFNASIEEELNALIEDFQKIDWYKSEMSKELLFHYETKEIGWMKVGLLIPGINITLMGASLLWQGVESLATGNWYLDTEFWIRGAAGTFPLTWLGEAVTGFFNDLFSTSPDVVDEQVKTFKCGPLWGWNCTRWARYLVWPKVKCGTDSSYTRGRYRNCMKNFYIPTLDKRLATNPNAAEYIEKYWFPWSKNSIIDPWMPKFYPTNNSEYFIPDMGIRDRLNQAYAKGKKHMISKKPSGRISRSKMENMPKFPEDVQQSFMPDYSDLMGANKKSWKQKALFSQKKINAVKCSIVRYATCGWLDKCKPIKLPVPDDLSGCAASEVSYKDMWRSCGGGNVEEKLTSKARPNTGGGSSPRPNVAGGSTPRPNGKQVNCEADDIGFRNFFQTDDDAKQFAEYVYQMHWFWPHLSDDNFKTYPKFGLETYFSIVLRKVKDLGSLNHRKAGNYYDAYSKYLNDLENRAGEYKLKYAEAALGEKSKNVALDKAVMAEWMGVDFKNGKINNAFMSQYSGKIKQAPKGSVARAAIEAADSLKSKAYRSKRAIAERKNWDKKVGSTKRGQQKLAAVSKMTNAFGNRYGLSGNNSSQIKLASVKNTVPLNGIAEDGSKRDDGYEKGDYDKGSYGQSGYGKSGYNLSGYGGSGYAESGYADGAEGSSTSSARSGKDDKYGQLNGSSSGLSNADVNKIIDSAKRDRSLYQNYEDETLFQMVSKVYKRNLSKVLVRESDIRKKKVKSDPIEKEVEKKIDSGTKKELKMLLEQ